MRSLVVLLLAAGLLCVMPRPAAAEHARMAREGAEIRAATGFAGEPVARPAKGAVVEVLERRSEWARVRVGDKEGWIHEVFLVAAEEPAPPAPVVVAPTSEPARPDPAPPPPSRVAEADSPEDRVDRIGTELRQIQAENAYLIGKLASMTASEAMLRDRLAEAIIERDDARRQAEQEKARAGAAAGPAAEAAVEASLPERREPVASDRDIACAQEQSKLAAAHAGALAEFEARHERELADARAHHDDVMEQFIDTVTRRHDDALEREMAAIAATCDRLMIEERREHERALKVARRESGYETELARELRTRLDVEIEEARTRWEAKQRGLMYDVERARREEGERVRIECEGQRLATVNVAIARGEADKAAALAKERREADLRCQVALEMILERASLGGDMTKVREAAEAAARRRSGSSSAGEAEAPAAGGSEAPAAPPQPSPGPPVPVPVPVPWPPQQERPR